MIRHARLALSALIVAGVTSGCSHPPLFEALTTPPPFTQAALCDQCDESGGLSITLTKGVALAFACFDAETGDPCSQASAKVADPSVARVLDGYLDTLAPATTNLDDTGVDGASPESVMVVVGEAIGETTLTFNSTNGKAVFDVTVLAP